MKKSVKMKTRALVALLLAAIFCVGAFPVFTSAATYSHYSCRDVINGAQLRPQKTGFITLDKRVETLISGFKKNAKDTFELLQACYDWLVRNVTYERSLVYYPHYDFASRTCCPFPYLVVYFAYEPLFKYEGVCDNFACAFAVMARAIGLDAYIKTGTMTWSAGTHSHTWCEIEIDGVSYLFDAQADNSIYASRGKEQHWYFGRKASTMGSEYGYDTTKTAQIRKGTNSVYDKAEEKYCFVTCSVGGNGSVTYGGVSESRARNADPSRQYYGSDYTYKFSGWLPSTGCASFGATCTFTAKPNSGASFLGWYVGNKLVSTSTQYSLTAKSDTLVEALFSGERFNDVASGTWYHDAVYYCANNSLMSGVSMTRFAPTTTLSRAMAVTVIAKMINVDASKFTEVSFEDVVKGSWYAPYVEWAKSVGITAGISETRFAPAASVTREQFAVFLNALARYKNYGHLSNANISGFSDASSIHSWALNAMKWAYAKGIISGNDKKQLSPLSDISRAEAAVMVKKFRAG